jgi:two-component system, OmpR family, sensor histidine kinase BaeS
VSQPRPGAPLDQLPSIKVKLGLLVAASVTAAAVLGTVGTAGGVPPWLSIPVAVVLALGVTQLLAVGMTSPLRQMTVAAQRMARGDYAMQVTATSQDEVGRLAVAFNTMARDLATVDRERRALVATVSHELRTPLAALTGRLENLADGVERPDQTVLDQLLAQVRRLGGLVTDLLDLSRVDAGLTRLDLTEVDIATLVEEARADVVLPGHQASYDVQVAAGLTVTADPGRLRQLLVNLLDNAVRHGPPGGTVTVVAERHGDRWWLEVRDEGPGLPAADRERAFERFGTGISGGGPSSGGGTGLGLAVARWVAQLHGGTVGFGDAGTDTRLRLDLPVRPDQEAPAMTAPTAPTALPPSAPTGVAPMPVLDSLFGSFWPDRAPHRRPVVAAAAGAGLLAAVVVPFREPGLGSVLVLVACGLTVLLGSPHVREPFTLACGALATLLVLPVILLDAGWIDTLCVLAATAVLLIGVTRARTVLGFVITGLAWPLSSLRGLPWFGRTLRGLGGRGSTPALVRTVAWSAVGVLVFGLLFVSADALVASWVSAVLPDGDPGSFVLRAFLAGAVFAVVLAAAYLSMSPPAVDPLSDRAVTPVRQRYEWLVPVLLVDAVFVVFLVAQATVVFGGHRYVERTTGLTYADYVHQGFGQLTVATALTLLVVWAAARKAPRDTPADRAALRGSLGLLCVLTLVVVASALARMHLYQEAYGFTRLRLLVDVFEGWLGLLVLGVMVSGAGLRAAWLPRAAVLSGAAALLGLAAINPDAWIARHNLDRYETTGKIDLGYLTSLSADAVPAIASLPPELRRCLSFSTPDHDDWLEWNRGRSRADAAAGTEVAMVFGPSCSPDPTP